MRDFYGTVAQVLPVVILALVWESRYFDLLRTQPRDHVRFWTLNKVRFYSLAVATIIIADITVCLMVLANVIHDNATLRALVVAGVILGLISLLYRIYVHILGSTGALPPQPPPGH
jgi:hypothetical protein